MSDPSPTKSLIAEFFATARGRLITALTVIVLLLGIASEVISLFTGYYNMVSARADAEAKTAPAVDIFGH